MPVRPVIRAEFNTLKAKVHHVKVIVPIAIGMPNHLHAIIDFRSSIKSINTIISNAKRFMAYKIVERLTEQNNTEILLQLAEAVSMSDRKKGKLHQVFERVI